MTNLRPFVLPILIPIHDSLTSTCIHTHTHTHTHASTNTFYTISSWTSIYTYIHVFVYTKIERKRRVGLDLPYELAPSRANDAKRYSSERKVALCCRSLYAGHPKSFTPIWTDGTTSIRATIIGQLKPAESVRVTWHPIIIRYPRGGSTTYPRDQGVSEREAGIRPPGEGRTPSRRMDPDVEGGEARGKRRLPTNVR